MGFLLALIILDYITHTEFTGGVSDLVKCHVTFCLWFSYATLPKLIHKKKAEYHKKKNEQPTKDFSIRKFPVSIIEIFS
jgi:hypothetical protein